MRLRHASALVIAMLAGTAGAQAPVDLAFRGGGAGSDVGQKVAVRADGTTAVVGEFEGVATFGSVTLTAADNPAARSDVFLVLFDLEGNALWGRRMGTGVFNDFAGDVAFDVAGNVIVSGYFTGVATFDGGANPTVTLTTRSDFDAFLAKYTPAGDLLWVRQSGGVGQDTGRGVVADQVGTIYQAGGFADSATFGDPVAGGDTTLVSAGSGDGFLAAYTSGGHLIWVRGMGGSQSDTAYDVDLGFISPGYAPVVLGQFNGVASISPTLALSSRGLSDVFVAGFAEDGDALWAEQIGGAGGDFGRGLSVDRAGQWAYAVGSFDDDVLMGSDILVSAGASDIFVAQLNAQTGEILGGRRGGGAGFDFADDVAAQPVLYIPTAAGIGIAPVYVAGYLDTSGTFTDPGGSTPATTAGGLDGVLVAYDGSTEWSSMSGGDVLAVYTLGGPNADRAYGVAVYPQVDEFAPGDDYPDPAGDIAVTGPFRSTMTLGTFTLESAGSNDVYVARFESCPATLCIPTALEEAPASEVALGPPAPNPAAGRASVSVTLDRPRTLRVELFDALGRRAAQLHEGPLPAGRSVLLLDASRLAAGAYVLRAEGEGVTASRRFAVR